MSVIRLVLQPAQELLLSEIINLVQWFIESCLIQSSIGESRNLEIQIIFIDVDLSEV